MSDLAAVGTANHVIDGVDLNTLTDDALKRRLMDFLGESTASLVNAAKCWAVLEQRGHNLSALRIGVAVYFTGIAAGVISPDAVRVFGLGGRPNMLKRVAQLPVAEQERLANGGTVPLVVKEGFGFTHRMFPLADLIEKPGLLNQIFGDRCIRTVEEQETYLSVPTPLAEWKGGRAVVANVAVDRKAGIVRIGKAEATLTRVIDALKKAGAI